MDVATDTDNDSTLDTAEDAIERLFETYERQYLRDDIAAQQMHSLSFERNEDVSVLLPTPHSIKSRHTDAEESSTVTDNNNSEVSQRIVSTVQTLIGNEFDESTERTGKLGLQTATEISAHDMLIHLFVDSDNEKRSREQHREFAFGLGQELTLPKVKNTETAFDINNNVEASSGSDTTVEEHEHEHSAESADISDDVSAESSALDNIATIVKNEYVLKELSKDIPKDDYVPLDVAVSDAVQGADDAFVVYEQPPQDQVPAVAVADVSMQYDVGRSECEFLQI